jgi:hypothetical protein
MARSAAPAEYSAKQPPPNQLFIQRFLSAGQSLILVYFSFFFSLSFFPFFSSFSFFFPLFPLLFFVSYFFRLFTGNPIFSGVAFSFLALLTGEC